MKKRNTWKMRLSVLLMVVMMLNMTITAFAEWRLEDDGWRYYKQDGTMVKGKEHKIRDQWFSFDENGVMRTGWLEHLGDGRSFYTVAPTNNIASAQWVKIDDDWYYFKGIEDSADGIVGGAVKSKGANPKWKEIRGKYYCFDMEGKMLYSQILDVDGKKQYAFEDGSLADHAWLLLQEDGSECPHKDGSGCTCSWYYFKGLEVNGDKLEGGAVVAPNGEINEKSIQNITYAFDDKGKMLSRAWNDKTKHYFQYNGAKAVNKNLLIGDKWYTFNSEGKGDVASPADAKLAAVSSIAPVEKNVSVAVGKEAEISFKVELAKDSNATNSDATSKALTKDHDFWIKCTDGKTKNAEIKDGNIYKMTYEPGKNVKTEQVYLWIDGIKSEPVNVNVMLAEPVKDEDEIDAGQVGTAIDNIFAGFGDDNVKEKPDPVSAANSLETAYANDDLKNAMQTKLLDDVKSGSDKNSLKALEAEYMDKKKITSAKPEVSGDAAQIVGDSDNDVVSIVGAGLNVPDGKNSVQLQISVPEEEYTLEGAYQNTIALDFTLKAYNTADAGDEGSELSGLRIPVVISVKAPAGFTSADKIFNLHNGDQLEVKFEIKGGKVYFVTDQFSTYVFAITDKTSTTTTSPGSSSGGKNNVNSEIESSRNAGANSGEWIQDAKGWWIRLKDGTYPVNTWMYLDYNRVYKWYHFDMTGYMRTGWFTDVDGHIYYLNPISDGTKGAMLTGWQFIDGYWYYFNPSSDGTKGALLVNTTTPDGYVVNEKGQWVQ